MVGQGGVAKLEDFRNASPQNFPVASVAKNEEFRNAQGGFGGEIEADQTLAENDLLSTLPQPVLTVGRGRPKAVTPQMQEQLCLLLSVGLSRRQAAAYLGIDHTTLSHTAARDAELSQNLKRAEDIAAGRPLLSIFDASRKSWRAAVWLVEHRRQYPPALTPEEKAAKHQESLEEVRRASELSHEHMRSHQQMCDADQEQREAKELARRQAENAERFRPRRKKVKSAKAEGEA